LQTSEKRSGVLKHDIEAYKSLLKDQKVKPGLTVAAEFRSRAGAVNSTASNLMLWLVSAVTTHVCEELGGLPVHT
jgi:hypothetical protein